MGLPFGSVQRPAHQRRPPLYCSVTKKPAGHPGGLSISVYRPVYLSIGPIVTDILPMPSTSHSSLSPATQAATPDGVPVMMMSVSYTHLTLPTIYSV